MPWTKRKCNRYLFSFSARVREGKASEEPVLIENESSALHRDATRRGLGGGTLSFPGKSSLSGVKKRASSIKRQGKKWWKGREETLSVIVGKENPPLIRTVILSEQEEGRKSFYS